MKATQSKDLSTARKLFEHIKDSEAVYRKKDNTMAKRKMTKGHTTISKTLHRKLKIE